MDAAIDSLLFNGHRWMGKQILKNDFLVAVRYLLLRTKSIGDAAVEGYFVFTLDFWAYHLLSLATIDVDVQNLVILYLPDISFSVLRLTQAECEATLLDMAHVVRRVCRRVRAALGRALTLVMLLLLMLILLVGMGCVVPQLATEVDVDPIADILLHGYLLVSHYRIIGPAADAKAGMLAAVCFFCDACRPIPRLVDRRRPLSRCKVALASPVELIHQFSLFVAGLGEEDLEVLKFLLQI